MGVWRGGLVVGGGVTVRSVIVRRREDERGRGAG